MSWNQSSDGKKTDVTFRFTKMKNFSEKTGGSFSFYVPTVKGNHFKDEFKNYTKENSITHICVRCFLKALKAQNVKRFSQSLDSSRIFMLHENIIPLLYLMMFWFIANAISFVSAFNSQVFIVNKESWKINKDSAHFHCKFFILKLMQNIVWFRMIFFTSCQSHFAYIISWRLKGIAKISL